MCVVVDVRHCFSVDGEWSMWGVWSQCTHTCSASGRQYRTRVCGQPLYGGEECPGSDKEIQTCNELPCPGELIGRYYPLFLSASSSEARTSRDHYFLFVSGLS